MPQPTLLLLKPLPATKLSSRLVRPAWGLECSVVEGPAVSTWTLQPPRAIAFLLDAIFSATFWGRHYDFSPPSSPRNRVRPHPTKRNGRTLSFRAGRSGERPAYCVRRSASAASMAATLARRILSRNCAVTVRWQRRQRVRILSRSHSPPPSVTGRM